MKRIPLKTVLRVVAKLAVAYLTPGKVDDVTLAASIIHSGIQVAARKKMIESDEATVREALNSEPDRIELLDRDAKLRYNDK